MSMEFVMGSSLESLPKTIDFNFEELKTQLAESLELYAGLVVTEDGIKAAKEDRARLNKLREALETKRKEVKRECMAPYTDFEAKVKELVGLIDQPIAAIDGQLKAYEEQRRAAKRADILAIYEETVFAEAVKLKYLENLDLHAALAERARLQEQAAQLRKYEEQLRPKEADTVPEPHREPVDGPIPQSDAFREMPPKEAETIYRLAFECQVTMSQAKELSAWLKARNIPFRRV